MLFIFFIIPRLSEASCSSQIETARAVVAEMGEETSHKSGINDWAKLDYKNSERGCEQSGSKTWDNAPNPITEMDIRGKKVPWISPKSWLQYIINNGLLYILSGLHVQERDSVEQTWQDFWRKYEILHPMYSLFQSDNFDPATTIGLYIHGDEGRTLKKGGIMVTSLQSILGWGLTRSVSRDPGTNESFRSTLRGIPLSRGLWWMLCLKLSINLNLMCSTLQWILCVKNWKMSWRMALLTRLLALPTDFAFWVSKEICHIYRKLEDWNVLEYNSEEGSC